MGLVGGFDNKYNAPSLEYLRKHIGDFNDRVKFLVIGKTQSEFGHWRVVFTGYVEDYVDTLSTLDALLVYRTIPTDGAINRIVEAMAMGIPVFSNPIASKSMDYAIPTLDYYMSTDESLPRLINEYIFKDNSKLGMDARVTAEIHYSDKIYKKKLLEVLN